MGVNAHNTDSPTELVEKVTASKEATDTEIRNRVRRGELSVEDYLIRHKGYTTEHAAELAPAFRQVIFKGDEAENLKPLDQPTS